MSPRQVKYLSYPDFTAWCQLRSYRWHADLTTGVVYRTKTGKPLNNQEYNGYYYVSTFFMGLKVNIPVHRIIWIAAHGKPILNQKMTIDHINGNRTDNRLENLRLITREENIMIGNRKCSPELVEKIREEVRNGSSRRSAAKKYQLSRCTVGRIVERVGCYAGA